MDETKLTHKEKAFIKKELLARLKYLRYMVHAMVIICIILIDIPIFVSHLKEGEIVKALVSTLGLLYPILFFGGFYLLFEFLSGNQIFKFMKGDYTFTRETIAAKYRETGSAPDTFMHQGLHKHRRTYTDYCDTIGHSRVPVEGEESYRNADNGKTCIVIQFGKNKNNVALFVPPEDNR